MKVNFKEFVATDKNILIQKLSATDNRIDVVHQEKHLFTCVRLASLATISLNHLKSRTEKESVSIRAEEGRALPDSLNAANLTPAESTLLKIKDKFAFFRTLGHEEILAVTHHVGFLKLRRGEVVFEQDSTGQEVYFIVKGSVEISTRGKVTDKTGREMMKKITLAVLGADHVFGEMAPLTGDPRSAKATAVEDNTTILKFNISENVTAENWGAFIELYQSFVQVMSEKLTSMNTMILNKK